MVVVFLIEYLSQGHSLVAVKSFALFGAFHRFSILKIPNGS
jgi:hypothetical protein